MSGLFGKTNVLPQQDMRAFGLREMRANTNQQARPVPLLYGQQRLSLTFLSDCFDIAANPVTESVGKHPQQVGTNYYASFAGLVCIGPVDGIFDLLLNGETVFVSQTKLYAVTLLAQGSTGDLFMTATFQCSGPHGLQTGDSVLVLGADQPEYNGEFTITVVSATQFQYQIVPTDAFAATDRQYGAITAQVRLNPVMRANHPASADISLSQYGWFRIYWGTETQTQDSYLNTESGVLHPAYLGQCYIVFHQLLFGYNQTNVPNVEVVVARAPLPDWASLGSGFIENDGNPAYIIGDMFQNPRAGLALPDDAIDTAGLDAAAIDFADEDLGVSQAITRQQDLRSILKTLCETIDALPLVNASYLLSLLPIRPISQLNIPAAITDAELSDLPVFTPPDWTTTYTSTKVLFSDATLSFQDNMAEWRDTGVRNVVQNPDMLTLDRRWITRDDLATLIAQAAGQTAALPITTGKLKLRYNDARFAQLAPGAVFQVNFSLRPAYNGVVFRVMARSVPKPETPEYEIDFQADYTYLYSALLAAQSQTSGEDNGNPTVPALVAGTPNTRLRLIELPPGLCDGSPSLAAVVARPATGMTMFSLWIKKNYAWQGVPPDSYSFLQTQTGFAMHGFTQADYPATTRLIDLEIGVPVIFDGPDTSLDEITAFDSLANSMLGFIDDEILSLAGWTLLSPATYQLNFVRGRYGTPIADHEAGSQLLLVNRSVMPIIAQPNFRPGNTASLKVALASLDVTNATELDLLLAGLAWRVPPPCALEVNGTFTNATFPGGANQITASWVLPDPGGILPRFDLNKLYTRLQILGQGSALIYQTDIAWPATEWQFNFAALNGGHDANFTLVALTVCNQGWRSIVSGSQSVLNVTKYP